MQEELIAIQEQTVIYNHKDITGLSIFDRDMRSQGYAGMMPKGETEFNKYYPAMIVTLQPNATIINMGMNTKHGVLGHCIRVDNGDNVQMYKANEISKDISGVAIQDIAIYENLNTEKCGQCNKPINECAGVSCWGCSAFMRGCDSEYSASPYNPFKICSASCV